MPKKYSAFISDLHLQASEPQSNRLFDMFMEYMPEKLEKMFILGDLFEYWIGDDDKTPYHQKIIEKLANLANQGIQLYFIPGNRDFLIGKKFLNAIHAKLLKDPHPMRLYNRSMVLMHGDLLCTTDVSYLTFRRYTHNPIIQWIFLRLPLFIRRTLANKLRRTSQQSIDQKPDSWLDVTDEGVQSIFQVFTREYLIHGHTHKPGTHQVSKQQQRIVLGAWHEKGSMILCNEETAPILVEFSAAHELITLNGAVSNY